MIMEGIDNEILGAANEALASRLADMLASKHGGGA